MTKQRQVKDAWADGFEAGHSSCLGMGRIQWLAWKVFPGLGKLQCVVLTAIEGLEVVSDTLNGFPPNSVSISVERISDEGQVTCSHGTTLGRREVHRLNEERPPVS